MEDIEIRVETEPWGIFQGLKTILCNDLSNLEILIPLRSSTQVWPFSIRTLHFRFVIEELLGHDYGSYRVADTMHAYARDRRPRYQPRYPP